MFLIAIHIDFNLILNHLSFSRFRINTIQFPFKYFWSYITNKCFLHHQQKPRLSSSILIENPLRRVMLSKIQHLFRQPISDRNKNFSNKKYSLFDYRCPICLNNEQYSLRWIALGCGHVLCSICAQQVYFGTKPMCPNCRSPIILSDLTILYI